MTSKIEYIALEEVPCNLCGSSNSKTLFKTRDYRLLVDDKYFNVLKCKTCGLVYVNPRPTSLDIHRYYNDEFYNANQAPEEALKELQDRLFAMSQHLDGYNPGRLLDVGCYRGEFIYHMKEKGWDVSGIEFSRRPPNLFGLDIHYGDIASAPFRSGSFDVVTIWAVFEHVYDPKETLAHVNRLLKPDGTVIILVPNFNSLPARIMRHDDVPRHITMFTKKTLREMLEMKGFRSISWVCSQDVYSGSVRGWLNFLAKRIAGEPIGEIQAQNRSAERWFEFSRCIHGREHSFMRQLDKFDIWMAPKLDRILDSLMLGFIMITHAKKTNSVMAI